jgi:hypothetical protein
MQNCVTQSFLPWGSPQFPNYRPCCRQKKRLPQSLLRSNVKKITRTEEPKNQKAWRNGAVFGSWFFGSWIFSPNHRYDEVGLILGREKWHSLICRFW